MSEKHRDALAAVQGGATHLRAVAPLTEVLRGGVVESRHRGAVAVVEASGALRCAVGDPDLYTFWRSSAKPFQALPVIASGAADRFGLEPRHLAVLCGSHVGKDYHQAAVREILERAGIPERALRNAPSGQSAIAHGCSGKHAGMLATARHLGEPPAGYTDSTHPVQRRILETLASLAGVAPDGIARASDGCSVPTFAMPLRHMALAFARLLDPVGLRPVLAAACRRIVAAMQAHPELLSGAEGDTADLTSALVARKSAILVAKSGAEALFCVGIAPGVLGPRGIGLAVKAEDGGSVQRSCYLATVEALRQLGVLAAADISALRPYLGGEILDVHGTVVGGARPCYRLGGAEEG